MVPLAYEFLFSLVEVTGEEELERKAHKRGVYKDDEEEEGLVSLWRPKAAVALTQRPYLSFVSTQGCWCPRITLPGNLCTCLGTAEAESTLPAPCCGARRAKLQNKEEPGGRRGQRLMASCRGVMSMMGKLEESVLHHPPLWISYLPHLGPSLSPCTGFPRVVGRYQASGRILNILISKRIEKVAELVQSPSRI